MKIGIECGQRFWSRRSWSYRPLVRKFVGGVAVGPVMLFRSGK